MTARTRGLSGIRPRRFAGIVWRAIGTRFLGSALASAGSRERGGRFNPPGRFETLYVALSPDTALAERDGILLPTAGIRALPRLRTAVLLRIACRLEAVLDLSDDRIRARLDLSLAELLGPWLAWESAAEGDLPPTQAFGAMLHASRRFEAILYPSTKDATGRCLAIFPDRLRAASTLLVDDPDGTVRSALRAPLRHRPRRARRGVQREPGSRR
jgi:RES domain-containing protein